MAATRRDAAPAGNQPLKHALAATHTGNRDDGPSIRRDDEVEVSSTSRPHRGSGRQRLLEGARELFNDRGYEGTTTREIAQRADLSETLLFRYYGSKAGLFRVAMVDPFVEFVQQFAARRHAGEFNALGTRAETREFLTGMYDVFAAHRGLVAMFWAGDVHVESELAESGLLDAVQEQFDVLVTLFREHMQRRRIGFANDELTTRATMAMVSSMATFGPSFYGRSRPSREAVIDELAEMVIRGHSRRG
jgi:AcrR family transcriptional regulator